MKIEIKYSSALLAALLLSACSKPAADAPANVNAQVQAAVATAGVPAEALTAAPPAGVSGAVVDVCALLTEADAAAVLGTLAKPPEAKPARGSLLGECSYFGAKGSGSVSAHPANEFKGTIDYAGQHKPAPALSGLGTAAYATEYGVMVQPAGKPYFLSIFIVGADGPAMSEALARKLKL